MLRRRISRCGIIAAVSAFTVIGLAGSTLAASFSANMDMNQGQTQTMKAKIYVSGKKMRTDTSMGKMGTQSIIARPDKEVAWMIYPAQKSYMEMPLPKEMYAKVITDPAKQPGAKKIGTERYAGYMCDKYKVTAGSGKMAVSGVVWYSKQLNYVLKSETNGTRGQMSMHLTNIKEGTQPASRFELPKGLKKMQMPNNMGQMKGRPMPGRAGK